MAGNMEEMKQLGKQMEHLRTEHELEQSGRMSDPDQHQSEGIVEKNS